MLIRANKHIRTSRSGGSIGDGYFQRHEYTAGMKEAELERHLKAFANRRRLAILKYLRSRNTANVSDVAEAIKLSFTSTSKHLTMLERLGVVEKEQKSLNVFYRLAEHSPRLLAHVLAEL